MIIILCDESITPMVFSVKTPQILSFGNLLSCIRIVSDRRPLQSAYSLFLLRIETRLQGP